MLPAGKTGYTFIHNPSEEIVGAEPTILLFCYSAKINKKI